MAIPQMCNLSLSGLFFSGTDIGGFVADTTPELLIRWVQVGCFSTLFRNHSAIDSIRQEPWCFGEQVLNIYRKFVHLRYRLIPYFYDLFFSGEQNGLPVLRPLVFQYFDDENVKNLNDEFMVGDSMLVAPVVTQGSVRRLIYLPKGLWYDYWSGEMVEGGSAFVREAPLDFCPLYIKAGSVIPVWPVQYYIGQKTMDTLELNLYPGEGEYCHFQDDGESFDYRDGAYNKYFCKLSETKFSIECVHNGYMDKYRTLRIIFSGKAITVPLETGRAEITLI
jgi:alpha-glucosidase